MCIPLDGKSSNTGLLGEDVPHNSIGLNLFRRLVVELLRIVFVVHVITNTNEFTTIIRASKKNNGNPQDLGRGKFGKARGFGLENELAHTGGDGTNKEGVEHLIVLGAIENFSKYEIGDEKQWILMGYSLRVGRTDIGKLPLKICRKNGSVRIEIAKGNNERHLWSKALSARNIQR